MTRDRFDEITEMVGLTPPSEKPEDVLRVALDQLPYQTQFTAAARASLDSLTRDLAAAKFGEREWRDRAHDMERERDEARTAVRHHETLAEQKWRAYVDALVPPRDQALLADLQARIASLEGALRDMLLIVDAYGEDEGYWPSRKTWERTAHEMFHAARAALAEGGTP